MRPPLEPLDSAGVAADAVRAALRGEPALVAPRYPSAYRAVAPTLAALPTGMRSAAIALGARLVAGVPAKRALEIDDFALDAAALEGWPDGPFEEVHMGAPSGAGAAAAAAAGAPYLPTSALLAIKCPKGPDDLARVVAACRRWGPEIAARTPERQVLWHHDPVHDRFLVGGVLHLRLRLSRMPALWQGWLRDNLARGGRVVVRDLPGYRWPRWDLGDAGALQVGGLGALAPGEFPAPDGLEAQDAQESEWGCEEGLVESVVEWGRRSGAEVVALRHGSVADLVSSSWHEQVEYLGERGFVREGVAAVDCFTFLDPGAWHRLGIPVAWAPFNTRDAIPVVAAVLAAAGVRRAFWTSVPAFPATEDTASYEEWDEAMRPFGGVGVGVDPGRYPVDPLAPAAWDDRHRAVGEALAAPLPA